MTSHTKGTGMTWVGRAIRRVEDPALVTGQGRFTADLPAAHWVRFLRSPAAAGKIESIKSPDGAMVITAADLAGVKPILPMLHKFEYKPLGQPILADGEVRFVGEPVAAVVAASEEEAEDIVDEVEDRSFAVGGDRRGRGVGHATYLTEAIWRGQSPITANNQTATVIVAAKINKPSTCSYRSPNGMNRATPVSRPGTSRARCRPTAPPTESPA